MPLASRATTTARKPAIRAPISGIKAPRNTSEANGSASGTPMIASPAPTPAASVSATRNVARTYPISDPYPARPASSHPVARTRPGTILTTYCQMLRPPYRKKISVNSTNTAAVTSSVTVAAVDSAPLVSFAWLLCSAWIAALPALSICSPRRWAGPSISHLRVESMLRAHLLGQIGHTDDELADDERQDAAQNRETAQQDHRHRAATRQTPPVQPVHRPAAAKR